MTTMMASAKNSSMEDVRGIRIITKPGRHVNPPAVDSVRY